MEDSFIKPFVIGYGSEGVIEHFNEKSAHRNYTFLDIDLHVCDAHFNAQITKQGLLWRTGSEEWLIAFNAPIYHRFFMREEADPASASRLQQAYDAFLAFSVASPADCLFINRPLNGALNSSKIAHSRILQTHGFQVPFAFACTERSKLVGRSGDFISKGCSGVRTIARQFSAPEAGGLAAHLRVPAMLQSFVRGPDVRVHILGYQSVALRFDTDSDDYRYAKRFGFDLTVTETDMPSHLLPCCWSYMKAERLEFVGFDFKVDEDGSWWLLEANPMPGYAYFDKNCDGKITDLIWTALDRGYSNMGAKPHTRSQLISAEWLPTIDRGRSAKGA